MALEPFVDALPIPKMLKPKESWKDSTYYEVRMQDFEHNFHRDLKPTKVWGYEGQIPGPVIEVEKDECTHIKWLNEITDEKHFLPVDHSLHSSGEHMPEVRTVVHLHGAEVEPESDGYPDAWFTPDFAQCGARFTKKIYTYTNHQPATTLWYHDHAIGITRLNVYAGLAGMYLIRSREERFLNLPSGIYEIPLIIQDKSFTDEENASPLFYPKNVANPPPTFPEVSITPGFAGDTIIVNGKAWPFLNVEKRKYRFRMLNASNERFYRMRLSSGQPFIQIGSDGGLLEHPVLMNELIIAPSERLDVVIDFTDQPAGTNIILTNTASTPFDFGAPTDPNTDGRIMQFRVRELAPGSIDTSRVPECLTKIEKYKEKDICVTRDVTIDVARDHFNRLLFLLNRKEFIDGVNEEPVIGEMECWRIINPGLGYHPIHIHQIQFQVLDRIPFDTAAFNQTGQLRFTGDPIPPPANETGWKDIIQAAPGQVTRLLIRFGPFAGRYVFHCHILEHEDHDMMRPFDVIKRRCKLVENEDCGKKACNDDKIDWKDCGYKDNDPKHDWKDCNRYW